MGCSHPTSNFTTLCKKKTASAFLHADGFWRRWWVLPRPKNSPLGCFCPAGRKAPGTGCSHPTSNFTTPCKKKTASAFLHADGSGGDGGFSRALKTAHRTVFARRDAKRRARAVLIPPATSLHCAKRKPPALFFTLTALAEMVGFEPTCPIKDKTISSRSRYDHFDTSPYCSLYSIAKKAGPVNHFLLRAGWAGAQKCRCGVWAAAAFHFAFFVLRSSLRQRRRDGRCCTAGTSASGSTGSGSPDDRASPTGCRRPGTASPQSTSR